MYVYLHIYIYIWIWRPCRMVMDIYREIHMYTIYYIYTVCCTFFIHKCLQTEREKQDPRCLAPRPWRPSSLYRPPNLGPWKPRWIPEVEKGKTCREKILENFLYYIIYIYMYLYLYVYIFYIHIYCTNIYIYKLRWLGTVQILDT